MVDNRREATRERLPSLFVLGETMRHLLVLPQQPRRFRAPSTFRAPFSPPRPLQPETRAVARGITAGTGHRR